MLRFTTRFAFLAVLLVAVSACGEDFDLLEIEVANEELTPDPDAELVTAIEEITSTMGLEAGSLAGVSDQAEAPAFGNTVFANAFGGPNTPELTPNMATDTAVVNLPPDRVKIYNVMALWGRIRPNDGDFSPIQWDPALQVAEGDGVRVRREILFEGGDEVHEQTQRNLVEMTSWTGPHVDGVTAQVAIVQPAIMPTDVVNAPTDHFLAFRSSAHTVTVPANELGGLLVHEVIDRTGNGVLLASVRRTPAPCAVGFMKGRWARTSDRGGVFGGLWIQSNGRREGYLVGRWGVNEEGERVYRGKIVNMQGEFLAFMAGTYGGGVYEGEIYNKNRDVLGFMRGRYTGEDGHGHFLGGWRQKCVKDAPPRVCHLTADGKRVCVTPAQPAEPTDG